MTIVVCLPISFISNFILETPFNGEVQSGNEALLPGVDAPAMDLLDGQCISEFYCHGKVALKLTLRTYYTTLMPLSLYNRQAQSLDISFISKLKLEDVVGCTKTIVCCLFKTYCYCVQQQ